MSKRKWPSRAVELTG